MDFLELRSLGGTIDLPGYFERHPEGVVAPAAPPVRVIATSMRLIGSRPEDFEEFYRFAHLASRFNAPYLRVFGKGGDSSDEPSRSELQEARQCVREMRAGLAERHFTGELLLETHDVFSSSDSCTALNASLERPLLFLWDSHHTWRLAKETPEATWRQLGPLIRHIHFKDSAAAKEGGHSVCYVPPGEGAYPTRALTQLLTGVNYTGGLSLEWEKLWHPELPNLEGVLPKFRELCRRDLAS